ncbi:MAG TPA: amidase family protein, partial [Propionicimonas sp.]|nr:amidase family protein [Propionicimonas sp.]
MSGLLRAGAAELAARIAAGEVSAREVTAAHLDQITGVDDTIKAFLHVDGERALVAADAVDAKRAAGEELGPLAGVPLAMKDIFTMKGAPTTCGSRILEGWVPPYNSTITDKLLAAGVVVLGKTNMDEFAMGSSTENSGFFTTHNPWDTTRIPGGSGGGSAAALASFEAPLAIGTDTGGSIRQPASVTGTVGVKPTYGGTSRYGVVAMASSLDTPGPCARTVLDAALLHQVIAGLDPREETSINAPVPDVLGAARHADVKGMRIGV